MFTGLHIFFLAQLRYNKDRCLFFGPIRLTGGCSRMLTSSVFWLVMTVCALFLGSILTAAYNDDKTKGL